jgi:hypothetical protein
MGPCLPTGARPDGRPTCTGRAQGLFRCDHDRCDRDRPATWDDDSSRATFCCGHRSCQHGVVTPEPTVPLPIRVDPGHVTDDPLGPSSLDRLLKTGAAPQLSRTCRASVYDQGLDARGIYDYLQAKQIAPVLALPPRRGEHPAPTDTATQGTDAGVPRGPAGLPMRRHRSDSSRHRIYDNGPITRPTQRHGPLPWLAHLEACPRQLLYPPDTQTGPVVSIRTADAPRLSPPIPRDRATFNALMTPRTGCERSNSLTKVTDRRGERPCRRATQLLGRLSLVSLLAHAQAWLAEDRHRLGEDPGARLCAPVAVVYRLPAPQACPPVPTREACRAAVCPPTAPWSRPGLLCRRSHPARRQPKSCAPQRFPMAYAHPSPFPPPSWGRLF